MDYEKNRNCCKIFVLTSKYLVIYKYNMRCHVCLLHARHKTLDKFYLKSDEIDLRLNMSETFSVGELFPNYETLISKVEQYHR